MALLDPDPYWECGSGSRSKEIGQNLHVHLISSLSKRQKDTFYDLFPLATYGTRVVLYRSSVYFLLNSKSSRATIAAKNGKVRKGNEEDIVLLKQARRHVNSEKFICFERFETSKMAAMAAPSPRSGRLNGVFSVLGVFAVFRDFGKSMIT